MSNQIVVSDVLKDIGIPANLKGYYYLRCAIVKALESPNIQYSLTSLYHEIAMEFNTTYHNVERCIRTAISSLSENCNQAKLLEIFGYLVEGDDKNLTNSQFIFGLTNYIQTYPL